MAKKIGELLMKKSLAFGLSVLALNTASLQTMAQIKYPVSHKTDITNNYFGVDVPDPYRWLEFEGTEETKQWVKEQNQTTESYLSGIPFRNELRKKLNALWNYPKYELPHKENGIYYFFKNDGLQNQSVLYSQKDLKSEPEVFLDPNKFSDSGTAALGELSFSKKGKYCAYTVSQAGSDWSSGYVMEVATKKLLGDTINWLKFTTISWQGDEGFYYSRYPEPKDNGRWTNQNRNHAVYYHKVGDPQSADKLVYEDQEHPFRFHFASVTEDDRFLLLYTSEGTSAMQIMMRTLSKGDKAPFRMVLEGFKYEAEVFDNDKKYLFAKTNVSAPRYRVVAINLINPFVNNWETMIPEQKEVLETIKPCGGSWFGAYLKDASSTVSQFTTGGYKLKDISLPAVCAATVYGGKMNDDDFFYSYSSFVQPTQIFRLHVSDRKTELFKGSEINQADTAIETKQVFFNSEDGTRVPMFITHKKGLQLDGTNPVLMFGYGGFNVPLKPEFNVSNLFFIEQGGIYVQVNTRGGSEYGEKWHNSGKLKDKQNVFDDFIGAAEYLVDEKYTNSSKIAIAGRSNGGLLVGACMVQRPELFRVALPEVGVLDMLRYQKFTIGASWIGEYGSSDDRNEFDNLYSYSPLHNLKADVTYPATLITTADHDDRVVPAHSFKFAARLQECQKGSNPVLIRVETDAGHGEGKPTSKALEEASDKLSFLMYNLAMDLK
jgi:prolyl oligopeptidase